MNTEQTSKNIFMYIHKLSLIFPNSIFKLKHLRKPFTKMLITQTFLTNVQQKLLIIYMFKNLVNTVPKLELRMALVYLGNNCNITKKTLNKCIGKCFKFCKFKIIFQTGNRLKNTLRFIDHVPETLQSNFVSKFKCGNCTASYYGKSYRHTKV